MQKIIVVALLASLLLAGPVLANDDSGDIPLTHHVDLWQVSSDDGHVKAYDLSYHFTVIDINRFSFLGAGLGFDIWSECDTRRCALDDSDRKYFGSPFIVVPLASVRLTKMGSDGAWSLGSNYVYQFRNEDHAITVGFMISFR